MYWAKNNAYIAGSLVNSRTPFINNQSNGVLFAFKQTNSEMARNEKCLFLIAYLSIK